MAAEDLIFGNLAEEPTLEDADELVVVPGGDDTEDPKRITLAQVSEKVRTDTGPLTVPDGSVSHAAIQNNAITNANLADGSVAWPNLQDDSVDADKLQDGAVGTDQLDDGAVTAAKLAPGVGGATGPRGPAGPAGAQGPPGAASADRTGFIVSASPASAVTVTTPAGSDAGAWTAWRTLTTLPAITAAQAGHVLLTGEIHGTTTGAPSGGGDRVLTESRLVRTRSSADTVLSDHTDHSPRNIQASSGSTSTAFSTASRDADEELVTPDVAEAGDVYRTEVRIIAQATSGTRSMEFPVARNKLTLAGLGGVKGDAGPQGPAGADGSDGADGAAGATGPRGPTGPQGIQGFQGPRGERGLTGQAGAQGIQGDRGPIGPAGTATLQTAAGVPVNTNNFSGNLSADTYNLQLVADAFDALQLPGQTEAQVRALIGSIVSNFAKAGLIEGITVEKFQAMVNAFVGGGWNDAAASAGDLPETHPYVKTHVSNGVQFTPANIVTGTYGQAIKQGAHIDRAYIGIQLPLVYDIPLGQLRLRVGAGIEHNPDPVDLTAEHYFLLNGDNVTEITTTAEYKYLSVGPVNLPAANYFRVQRWTRFGLSIDVLNDSNLQHIAQSIPEVQLLPTDPLPGNRVGLLTDQTLPGFNTLTTGTRSGVVGYYDGVPTTTGSFPDSTGILGVLAYGEGYSETTLQDRIAVITTPGSTKTPTTLTVNDVDHALTTWASNSSYFITVAGNSALFVSGRKYRVNITFSDGTTLYPDRDYPVGDYVWDAVLGWQVYSGDSRASIEALMKPAARVGGTAWTLGDLPVWRGTRAAYNAISPKDTGTIYLISG